MATVNNTIRGYKTFIFSDEYDSYMEMIRSGKNVPAEVIGILLGRAFPIEVNGKTQEPSQKNGSEVKVSGSKTKSKKKNSN